MESELGINLCIEREIKSRSVITFDDRIILPVLNA